MSENEDKPPWHDMPDAEIRCKLCGCHLCDCEEKYPEEFIKV